MRLLLSCAFCLSIALLAAPHEAAAQRVHAPGGEAPPAEEGESSVVVARAPGALGVGDVGASLVQGSPRYALRRAAQASLLGTQASAQAAAQQREGEVTIDEFRRGALIGGAVGTAAGALVGVLLGGGDNPRWETALPLAMAGLSVGAPAGVYLHTGRTSRYLWGTAGAAGAVVAGTAVYFIEAR